jgi:hypothetical protein
MGDKHTNLPQKCGLLEVSNLTSITFFKTDLHTSFDCFDRCNFNRNFKIGTARYGESTNASVNGTLVGKG